jgi:diguanylate cyclase (GGDEF)-like protein
MQSVPKASSTPYQFPPDVYASLVDALYLDGRSFFIGVTAAVLTTLISAVWTGEYVLFGFAAAITLVGVIRSVDMRRYANSLGPGRSMATVRRWEMRYTVGAVTHVALLGAYCFACFWLTEDGFVRLLSFALVLAYVVGIAGRNFSSKTLVNAQIAAAAIPLSGALVISGYQYAAVILIVLLPLFLSTKFIAVRLRGVLLDSANRAHDFGFLARLFDTALNNMPHGLAMFTAEHRLLVANTRFVELLLLNPTTDYSNFSLEALVREAVPLGSQKYGSTGNVVSALTAGLSGKFEERLVLRSREDRILEIAFQKKHDGGALMLVEDVTEREKIEERIRHLARFDALTGLPNRTVLEEELGSLLKPAGGYFYGAAGFAVLFVDLDHFKQINDTLGHTTGDRLLCLVAERLEALALGRGVVGRFGGDEFVILHQSVQKDEIEALAADLIGGLSRPYRIDHHELVIGATVGIAMCPKDGHDAGQLLKNADMALYQAKLEGRGSWQFFESEMMVRAQVRRNIENDLRSAIEKGDFEVYFQPLLDLRSNRYKTCEGLVRWRHSTRGLISPGDFVPIAEEMGLIVDLGAWVLRTACRECVKWPSDVSVAVNLSPIQFRPGTIVTAVRQALEEAGLRPDRLELEVTESVLLQDLPLTRLALETLRDMGVKITLDDFGTGYSSLSYLHMFRFYKIKIDRSFLKGLGTNERTTTLLRGTSRLAADLGMKVVVEGVETQEQFELVAAEPYVDEVQGYYLCKPCPVSELTEALTIKLPQTSRLSMRP